MVDLLVATLADVADPEVAGGAVEREPPRVPEAAGPYLAACSRRVDVRVVRRDRVGRGPGGTRVDAQDLSVQRRGRLRLLATHAAVPRADVEHAVGTERELPPVVVPRWLRDAEHLATCRRCGATVRELVLLDPHVTVPVRVVHVQLATIRREREAEQPALAVCAHTGREVEDTPGPPEVPDGEDPAAPGRHVDGRIVGPGGERSRPSEAGDVPEADRGSRRRVPTSSGEGGAEQHHRSEAPHAGRLGPGSAARVYGRRGPHDRKEPRNARTHRVRPRNPVVRRPRQPRPRRQPAVLRLALRLDATTSRTRAAPTTRTSSPSRAGRSWRAS